MMILLRKWQCWYHWAFRMNIYEYVEKNKMGNSIALYTCVGVCLCIYMFHVNPYDIDKLIRCNDRAYEWGHRTSTGTHIHTYLLISRLLAFIHIVVVIVVRLGCAMPSGKWSDKCIIYASSATPTHGALSSREYEFFHFLFPSF